MIPVLSAKNLRAGYGGKPVLLDVSIELRPEEVLCVIGHNGAGKSTLMRTLFGLATPEAGEILVDGHVLPRHVPRALAARVEWVMQALPQVRHFYRKRAGLLSGGQQQMVSIGRALLARPRCLLMDEPSIGLAPKLFQDLLQPIRVLQQQHGMSILLIEQNVREALRISDRVVVMKAGAIIFEAAPGELKDNARLMELY
jgi:branched-chain amino acid transport system ATP-binding protein